jgi:CheY-like chemotaxis protein
MQSSKKLGEVLIERQLLCQATVDRVMAIATRLGKRFGTVLLEMGLITEEELALALAVRYRLKPLFDFAKMTFAPQALKLFSAEQALENMLFPLLVEGGKVALAVADPTRTKIITNMAANNHLSVTLYVSTRSEIQKAICRHYFGTNVSEPTKKTVLLVEDNQVVLAVLADMLSKHYEVITAVDGFEAYKEVISKKPHVVLTDMDMPKLSGFELLYALKAVPETRHIPIILISGTADASAEAQAFDKGFFDFIPKPVKETTLLTRVKRAYEFSDKQSHLFD